MSTVAAVVIWTPGDPDPAPCLASLASQVDELVVVANPGGAPSTDGARLIANDQTRGFGANINRGVAATSAPYVVASNSDIEAAEGCIAAGKHIHLDKPAGGTPSPPRVPPPLTPGRPRQA